MSDPLGTTESSRDAQFSIKKTTQEAVESTRLAVQHRAMESAELILAELGIEGTDD